MDRFPGTSRSVNAALMSWWVAAAWAGRPGVGGEPIDAAGVYITSVFQNHLMVSIPYQIEPIRV
jgi:hypothetical protein